MVISNQVFIFLDADYDEKLYDTMPRETMKDDFWEIKAEVEKEKQAISVDYYTENDEFGHIAWYSR